MSRITRTGRSQSEEAFRVLLSADGAIPVSNKDYFDLTKQFLYQLHLIRQSCLHAKDRENLLYDKDGLIANSIATYALTQEGIFTRTELASIQLWLTDERFKYLIGHMMYWQEGDAKEISCGPLKEATNASEEEIDFLNHHVVKLAESVCEVVATNFWDAGHGAADVLGVLAQKQPRRRRFQQYEDFVRIRATLEKYYKLISSDYYRKNAHLEGKQPSEYTIDDVEALLALKPKNRNIFCLSDEEKERVRDLVTNKRELITCCQSTVSTLAYDAIHDKQARVAITIHEILDAQAATFTSNDMPLPSWRGRTLLHFVYSHFFCRADDPQHRTVFQDYNKDQIIEYFKILLQTLALIVHKNIPAKADEIIKDSFVGASELTLKKFLNDIPASRVKDLYLDLMALVEGCSTIDSCAEKLAIKFSEHNEIYQALQRKRPKEEESEQVTLFLMDEREIRDDFLSSYNMHQVSLNADVNQDIFNFEDQIRFSYNQHKAAVQQHQADNKILLCRQRVGVMGSASEIEDATLDEARVKIAEHEKFKSESWANYLIKEKELLTFFNSDDLRQRLYEKELALINAEYKKKLDLAGENEDQKQQAQQERGNKIEEAKQRFEFDRFNGSGSSKSSLVTVLPGLKFEFDTTTAVSLTVTNLYDGMNRKISEALGNRNGCVRAQGDYYEASQAAKARQDKINKAPFLKIQARYDNGIRQELKVERRKRNKQRWKIARYVGLGVLGMVGLGLLAAATVATLGLVHLSWIIPVVYFSVGGVVVAGSASGAIANEESRRSAIAKFFHKVGLSLRISQVSRQKKPTHVKPLSAVRDEAEEFVVVTPPPLPQEPPALISEDDRETVRSRVRAASNNSLTKVVMEPVERPRPRSAPPTVASTMSQRVFSPPIPDSSNDDEAASRFLADATW